jgi:hypothetical protein
MLYMLLICELGVAKISKNNKEESKNSEQVNENCKQVSENIK